MLPVRGSGLGGLIWLLAATAAFADPADVVLQCDLRESAQTSDARGRSGEIDYRTVRQLFTLAPNRFQVWSDQDRAWGPNFCLAENAHDQTQTICRETDTGYHAQFPVSQLPTEVSNGAGRFAIVHHSWADQYIFRLDDAGTLNLRHVRRGRTAQVSYYNKDAQGRQNGRPTNGPPDDWAGYNITITALGSCSRVQ